MATCGLVLSSREVLVEKGAVRAVRDDRATVSLRAARCRACRLEGRTDRDARDIEEWAREQDLPYFDGRATSLISALSTNCTDATAMMTSKWSQNSSRQCSSRERSLEGRRMARISDQRLKLMAGVVPERRKGNGAFDAHATTAANCAKRSLGRGKGMWYSLP